MKTQITKRKRKQAFAMVDNKVLRDENLSMQAKGLYSYLISLPDNWKIYKTELQKHFTNGRDAVCNAFNELIAYGCIIEEECRNEKGQFVGKMYLVLEEPFADNPIPENPIPENPKSDNTELYNTVLNKDCINKDFKEKENTKRKDGENSETLKEKKGKKKKDTRKKKKIFDVDEFDMPTYKGQVIPFDKENPNYEKFEEALKEYHAHKNESGKLTSIYAKRLLKKLKDKSGGDIRKAEMLLRQSLDKGWMDIYDLQEEYEPHKNNKLNADNYGKHKSNFKIKEHGASRN